MACCLPSSRAFVPSRAGDVAVHLQSTQHRAKRLAQIVRLKPLPGIDALLDPLAAQCVADRPWAEGLALHPAWEHILACTGCKLGVELLPDRLAIDARDLGDLPLAGAPGQQRLDSGFLVWLQDVQLRHLLTRGGQFTSCPKGAGGAGLQPSPDQFRWRSLRWPQVGDFGWPSGTQERTLRASLKPFRRTDEHFGRPTPAGKHPEGALMPDAPARAAEHSAPPLSRAALPRAVDR